MKYGMKLSNYDVAMIGNLSALTEDKMKGILMDKGDIEMPDIMKHRNPIKWVPLVDFCWEEFDDSFEVPNGKSMKRADRRKRTFNKHQQREKKYRDFGYPIELFSASERGKMREGVGMFPESQHQYTMYNRGKKKGEKPITTKQAISMIEHERWLDEQDAIAEYEEAERFFMMDEMESLMQEVRWLDGTLERANLRMQELMEHMDDLTISINSMKSRRYDCLKMIEKMKEVLNK